ncbi:hypothetical protein VTK56DRAFT_6137 [Thermocarpiscus australiensis]
MSLVAPSSYPMLQLLITSKQTLAEPPLLYFYLADGFLTPIRCVNGLIDLIAELLTREQCQVWPVIAALLFASVAPTTSDQSAVEISPKSAENLAAVTDTSSGIDYNGILQDHCSGRFPEIRDLVPGTWTVLMDVSQSEHHQIWEDYCIFQCAFVRPKNAIIKAVAEEQSSFGPEDLEVLDLEGFLRLTDPDSDFQHVERRLQWLDKIASNPGPEPLFSRTPMDNQTACDIIRREISRRTLCRSGVCQFDHLARER